MGLRAAPSCSAAAVAAAGTEQRLRPRPCPPPLAALLLLLLGLGLLHAGTGARFVPEPPLLQAEGGGAARREGLPGPRRAPSPTVRRGLLPAFRPPAPPRPPLGYGRGSEI